MDSPPAAPLDDAVKLRSYQQEMLQLSLEKNIIVAMDTGSGKTHIAVARIRAELERMTGDDVSQPLHQFASSSDLHFSSSGSWHLLELWQNSSTTS